MWKLVRKQLNELEGINVIKGVLRKQQNLNKIRIMSIKKKVRSLEGRNEKQKFIRLKYIYVRRSLFGR